MNMPVLKKGFVMFKSRGAEAFDALRGHCKKMASFFCFKRRAILNSSEMVMMQLDSCISGLEKEGIDLQDQLEARSISLKEKEDALEQMSLSHSRVTSKMELVSSLLSSRPLLSDGLSEFKRILYGDFLDFANRESSLAEEAKALLLMQDIERDLETVVAYPEIFMKNIVAIGGGFSSGKSALASSFFSSSEIQIPIGIEPVTAIPTYIVSHKTESITGFSVNGGTVALDASTYGRLSHDYVKSFGFNLRDIMPYMAIGTPLDEASFEHICLVDTPGYNPAESDGYTEEDKRTACEHLQHANALVWVIGLDSTGTVPRSDLDFLEGLDLSEKCLFVVANKADLKHQGDREEILEVMQEILEDYDIPYQGISAYSAEHHQEYHFIKQSFLDFLSTQNKQIPSRDMLVERLSVVFDMYIKAINKNLSKNETTSKELHSLRLDLLSLGVDDEFLEEGAAVSGDGLHQRIEKLKGIVECDHLTKFLDEVRQLKAVMIKTIDNVFLDITQVVQR
jgi:hypothetical protein